MQMFVDIMRNYGMSNRQFSLTVKAIEIIDTVPKRTRSKFVSDAVVNYAKKKDILDEYLIQQATNVDKITSVKKKEPTSKKDKADKQPVKKKVNIDEDF